MDYAIKNLRQIDDVAPRFGFSEVQEARFARRDLASETIGLAFHIVRPRQRQAFAHRHQEAEEIYVVLSGTGRVKLDDDIRDVSAMDAIRVAPHVAPAFEAGPDGLELLVFGPHHEGDAEVLTGQHAADILNDEYDSQGGNGDTAGFKGIFVRWAAKYANVANDTAIIQYLRGDFSRYATPSRRAVTRSPDCSILRAICACTASTSSISEGGLIMQPMKISAATSATITW